MKHFLVNVMTEITEHNPSVLHTTIFSIRAESRASAVLKVQSFLKHFPVKQNVKNYQTVEVQGSLETYVQNIE